MPGKETLPYAERGAVDQTLRDAQAATLAAAAITAPAASPALPSSPAQPSLLRSTVLPRIEHVEGRPRLVQAARARYEELRPLGAGGQAEVTLAHDHDIDRTVAVKRLLPEYRDDASLLRFAEEIRAVGSLEHPNVIPIHDVGVDEQGHYFVMKHVEGETLEAIIERLRAGDPAYLRRYTPEYRLAICHEVLRGVEHAHDLGIIHRDLKPGNVMVGPRGEVVVMDWGLAKRIGDAETAPLLPAAPRATSERARLFETQAGALLGTPAYMAPEQAAGRLDALDQRSDVYSLAVMFYEFLSLQHPRRHCQTVAHMLAEVVESPISKDQLLSDFVGAGAPGALAHFVRHGLHHEPGLRYASVAAMRARLEAVRDGVAPVECVATLCARSLHVAARGIDRHPLVAVTLLFSMGLSLLLVVAFVVWSLAH